MPAVLDIRPFTEPFLQLDDASQRRLLRLLRHYWGPTIGQTMDMIDRFVALHSQVVLYRARLEHHHDVPTHRRLLDRLDLLNRRAERAEGALQQWGRSQLRARAVASAWLADLQRLMTRLTADVEGLSGGAERGSRRRYTSLLLRSIGLPRSTIEAASALRLTPPFTLTRLRERYWQRALRFHPDRGGTPRAMQIVNSAYELLRAKLGGR